MKSTLTTKQMVQERRNEVIYGEKYPEQNIELYIEKHAICYLKVLDNTNFTMDSLRVSRTFIQEHIMKRFDVILVEFGSFSLIDTDVREFAIAREEKAFKAEAIVVSSMAQHILVRFYAQKMRKKGFVVEIFSTAAEARSWLRMLKR